VGDAGTTCRAVPACSRATSISIGPNPIGPPARRDDARTYHSTCWRQ
jgi:hypothetical protein